MMDATGGRRSSDFEARYQKQMHLLFEHAPSKPQSALDVQNLPPWQNSQSGSDGQPRSQNPSKLHEEGAGHVWVLPLQVTLPSPEPLAEHWPEVPLHDLVLPSAQVMLTEQSLAAWIEGPSALSSHAGAPAHSSSSSPVSSGESMSRGSS